MGLQRRIDEFWKIHANLQFAVGHGDPEAIAAAEREIEPSLRAICQAHALDADEARLQLQFFVSLTKRDAEDTCSVIRNCQFLHDMIDRYVVNDGYASTGTDHPQPGRKAAAGMSAIADDMLLNEAILDSMPDRIAVITPDYRYVYTNARNARHRDRQPFDMIGRHVVEFMGIERFEQRAKPNLDRCFEGETVEFTFAKQSQGRTIVVRCRMSPCLSTTGTLIGAIVMLQENADRRRSIAA